MRLTIYYDGQFWVGVFEETCDANLRACRYVFGPEPRDTEVLDLVNRKMISLLSKTKESVKAEESVAKKFNPKRMARLASEEIRQSGVSTKAQQALQQEYEHRKKKQAEFSKQQKEALATRKWELKKEKAKEKHRGR